MAANTSSCGSTATARARTSASRRGLPGALRVASPACSVSHLLRAPSVAAPTPQVMACCLPVMSKPSRGRQVYRAKFSAISAPEIRGAFAKLGEPNRCEALAVDARQELDLKVGVSFTRFQASSDDDDGDLFPGYPCCLCLASRLGLSWAGRRAGQGAKGSAAMCGRLVGEHVFVRPSRCSFADAVLPGEVRQPRRHRRFLRAVPDAHAALLRGAALADPRVSERGVLGGQARAVNGMGGGQAIATNMTSLTWLSVS